MIEPAYARTMARYNRWQNRSLMDAADALDDVARWEDRGAVFRSIAETLNHVLWDDRAWLARLADDDATARAIGARHPYTDGPRDWDAYKAARAALDGVIVEWADHLTRTDLGGSVAWTRGEAAVRTGFGFNVVHLFNHQTQHRGQVHAMLCEAGAPPGPTDLQRLAELG
ncbi:DinB family protein [Jannaschia sp. LMIT008]|uniref:DinB family protein n=1 Tax=Jannaschia maritima TaxID=3032585 RepID=UPI002810A0B7|nr:DinB family protein [Jannaschia sp. LMIT008]